MPGNVSQFILYTLLFSADELGFNQFCKLALKLAFAVFLLMCSDGWKC